MQERMDEVLGGFVARGEVTGLAWAAAAGDRTWTGVAGTATKGGTAVAPDTIFRIASMTKPITAVAALALVERCRLRMDEPVDPWLPELADRRVLRDPTGPLDDTVPAARPITLRDLLTFRLGYGMDFDFSKPQPLLDAFGELGLGAGPPEPQRVPAPDEFLRLLGTLPLSHQPGQRWLYNTGADVLGLLLTRVTGSSLEDLFRELVLEPLGMEDTSFHVPAAKRDRFGDCYAQGQVFDPVDGQWAAPPVTELGGAGLVSTVGDYLTFARMLLAGGAHGGTRLLGGGSVAAMTSDQLGDATGGPAADGSQGWGFGVGVIRRRTDHTVSAGSYGWSGGLGSSWFNDPAEGVIGVLLTTDMFTSPALPAVHQDFATTLFAALP
jgi:CubicO group peptidase (beta-lactamase class C family)